MISPSWDSARGDVIGVLLVALLLSIQRLYRRCVVRGDLPVAAKRDRHLAWRWAGKILG